MVSRALSFISVSRWPGSGSARRRRCRLYQSTETELADPNIGSGSKAHHRNLLFGCTHCRSAGAEFLARVTVRRSRGQVPEDLGHTGGIVKSDLTPNTLARSTGPDGMESGTRFARKYTLRDGAAERRQVRLDDR